MKETFNLLVENIDSCLSESKESATLALIEKEILLEKIRQLYVLVSEIESREYKAKFSEDVEKSEDVEMTEPSAQVEGENTPNNDDSIEENTIVEEEPNLFFDTEHESYEATDISKELEAISVEIESNSTENEHHETPKPEIIAEDNDSDIFENLEIDTQIEISDDEIKDNSENLFSEEDDLLHISAKKTEKNKIQQPSQRSLNDLFTQKKEDTSISGQYQHAKVGDLTKAISINDKFTYIKELFHNRGEDFSESVKMLNDCKDLNEAFDCLDKLKNKFYWDSSSEAYLSFCDLLRRKYS